VKCEIRSEVWPRGTDGEVEGEPRGAGGQRHQQQEEGRGDHGTLRSRDVAAREGGLVDQGDEEAWHGRPHPSQVVAPWQWHGSEFGSLDHRTREKADMATAAHT